MKEKVLFITSGMAIELQPGSMSKQYCYRLNREFVTTPQESHDGQGRNGHDWNDAFVP